MATFGGRIFLKPLQKSEDLQNTAEVYVNLGGGFQGQQVYPPYDARFRAACSEEQYDEVMNALKESRCWFQPSIFKSSSSDKTIRRFFFTDHL